MDFLTPALAALAGAVIAGIVTLLAGRLAATRDHQRWLREKRLEAYVSAVGFMTDYELRLFSYSDLKGRVDGMIHAERAEPVTDPGLKNLTAQTELLWAEFEKVRERQTEAMTPLKILGPASVSDASTAWMDAAKEENRAWWKVGKPSEPVITAMQTALEVGVKPPGWRLLKRGRAR